MTWGKQVQSASTWSIGNGRAQRWQPESELGHTPSAASRLNRVVPQLSDLSRDPEKTFSHRITSEFPFFIASGNRAVITSGFTQGGF